MRFLRTAGRRNPMETASLSRFDGIQPLLPCGFSRERRSAPMEDAGLWTISSENLALEQSR